MDQRALVARAAEGDHDAFTVLARDALARLDAAARLILRDAELARDAVQEALVRAWRDLPGLRDPDRFDAWLYRLTVHACLDLARRRRRRVVEVELTPLDGTPFPDPSELIAERDSLDRALLDLEPEERAVVILRYYLGMSVPEVAETLSIPLGTAKTRLRRSLAALRVTVTSDEGAPIAASLERTS